MDMLYILGNGSKHYNKELRWSLRSLEKYGRNVGSIAVVGEPPKWLSPEVKTIKTDNHASLVQKNIWRNVAAAVEAGIVDGTFLLQTDDHFFVKEVDFDEYPVYVIGEIPLVVDPDEDHYEYKLGLVGARWILGKNGMPTRMTSNHNPILVDAKCFSRYPWIARQCGSAEVRMNVWSILGNMYLYDHPEARVATREDIKICHAVSQKELDDILGYADVISIDDAAFDSEAFVDFMNKEFPTKSRWEV